jgi:hypothetical protein
MAKEKQLMECSHCGNKAPQTIEFSITTSEDCYIDDVLVEDAVLIDYILIHCSSCGQVSLLVFYPGEELGELKDAHILYPNIKKVSDNVPLTIKESYQEAIKVKRISNTAFLILIRKSLEFLCRDKGLEGRNLKEQIEKLSKEGIIPEGLYIVAEKLRLFGNFGAHDRVKISEEEISLIDDLFSTLIDYVYVLPDKIKKMELKLKELKKAC